MKWVFWIFILRIFVYQLHTTQAQRVAPGVPPQHYQQQPVQHVPQQQVHQQQQVYQQQPPPPPPPQQQQQQHQQQHQQQFQQVPVQQQHHVPVQQHQQQQPQHGHGHGHDAAPQQLLNAANIAHEKEHIKEHLDVPMDTSKMTEQELQFHYFKMHDADNNNKLDGCELIKSLIHWHEQGHNKDPNQQNVPEGKLFKDEELVNLIDPILNMDDSNKDGYIDYPEFVQAQQKARATESN